MEGTRLFPVLKSKGLNLDSDLGFAYYWLCDLAQVRSGSWFCHLSHGDDNAF